MKIFLTLAVVFCFRSALADEASARSGRSGENSPVVQPSEGEGDLTAEEEIPNKSFKAKKSFKDFDTVCKADSDPANCTNKNADKKTGKKKKEPKKPITDTY